jgi:hypothetical protein
MLCFEQLRLLDRMKVVKVAAEQHVLFAWPSEQKSRRVTVPAL